MELGNQIRWHKVPKKWKPNLIQRILIKLKIIKDKRFDGKKVNPSLIDEAGHWQNPNLNYNKDWKILKGSEIKM